MVRNLLVGSLTACMLMASYSALAADRNDAKAREAARLDKAIRENQKQLDVLVRQETTLKSQVSNFEKKLPTVRDKLEELQKDSTSAKSAMTDSQKDRQATEKAFQDAKTKLETLTKGLEESQSSASPFGVALAEYQAAKEAYGKLVDQIEESDEYKKAYEEAKKSERRLQELPEVRKKFIDKNPTVIEATADLSGKKSRYEATRLVVLGKDPNWSAASKALDEAKSRDAEADQKGKELTARSNRLANQLTAAQKEVKQLESELARAKSALDGIPGRKTSLQNEIERDRNARKRIR